MKLSHLERLGGNFNISIPTDESGLVGRECPNSSCAGFFKIKPGTGLRGQNLPCHCAYCGHTAAAGDFCTKDQLEYAKSLVLREVADALAADLKRLEFNHRPRGAFGVGFSLKVERGRPVPIRYYREPQLETHLRCTTCDLVYSVFGVFAFCPDCRSHNSLQILQKNLELVIKQRGLAAAQEEAELQRYLLEDALENCVSSFDAFGREACRIRASKSADPVRAASISFQNLLRAAEQIRKLFALDLLALLSPEDRAFAHRSFMQRHLLAHRAGVIDQPYLDATNEPQALLGRRISIDQSSIDKLARIVEGLGSALTALLPQP